MQQRFSSERRGSSVCTPQHSTARQATAWLLNYQGGDAAIVEAQGGGAANGVEAANCQVMYLQVHLAVDSEGAKQQCVDIRSVHCVRPAAHVEGCTHRLRLTNSLHTGHALHTKRSAWQQDTVEQGTHCPHLLQDMETGMTPTCLDACRPQVGTQLSWPNLLHAMLLVLHVP
jgi:hypothetical protein